ncbi:plasmid mobilization protein [Corynebacterium propinquum]
MPVKATEHQIDAWVSEAEAGYDVEALKKRGRGRPGRGAQPSQVIAVRLTAEELKIVDSNADELGISRSEFIRRAIQAVTKS